MLGEESVENHTFSVQEQTLVQTYLEGGGNLFVSGAEVGWDLDYYNNGSGFYQNYLKSGYVADDANVYQVSGVAGSIFEGLSAIHFDDGTHGTYDVNWPDCIEPYGGASVCLNYDGTSYHAAIQYEGLFGAGSQSGKLVYLGFPFETIYPESSRNNLMERIVNFFEMQTAVAGLPGKNKAPITDYRLCQNYPNPFNSSTIISFEIPLDISNQFVTLTVYNLLGERVKNLIAENKIGGIFQVRWNGTNDNFQKVTTGMYLYRLRVGAYIETKRMLFVE